MTTTELDLQGRRVGVWAAIALWACAGAAGCSGESSPPNQRGTGTDAAHNDAGKAATDSGSERFATALRFETLDGPGNVDWIYRNGEEAGHFAILESLGGGAAVLDYDGDGALDVFLPGGGEYGPQREIRGLPSALFRNLGDAQFVPVAEPARVAGAEYYSHGAAVGDYDNDGFPDVLLTGYGGLTLYRNQGDGSFVEVAQPSGLTDRLWSSSAGWGDLDGDGHLDLYVAHYVNWSFENNPPCPGPNGKREVCPPRSFDPLPDVLYMSNGDGTFRDASREAGLRQDGKGLGVLLADVDLDGRLDVYVANDTVSNFLYRNTGDGTLEDVSLISGTSLSDMGVPDGSMGVDLCDFNGDGLPDLWVANYERESFALYRNEGNCFFQHVSQAMGVTAVGGLYVGWGTVFHDFDNDGDEDGFVSNGHVIRYPVNAPVRQQPLLFENRDGKRLVNVAAAAGEYTSTPHPGRGMAAGDLNGDGRADLVVSNLNEPAAVLLNESAEDNHWLGLRLIGTASNRDAVGALVTVETEAGRQSRQIKGGGSYASTSERQVYFGLGKGTRVKSIEIRWPAGQTQTVAAEAVDQVMTVNEPARE